MPPYNPGLFSSANPFALRDLRGSLGASMAAPARRRVVNRTSAARFRGMSPTFADRLRPTGMGMAPGQPAADPLALMAELLPQLGLSQGTAGPLSVPGTPPQSGATSGPFEDAPPDLPPWLQPGSALPPSVTGRDDPFLAQLADAVVNGTMTVAEAARRYRARRFGGDASMASVLPLGPGVR